MNDRESGAVTDIQSRNRAVIIEKIREHWGDDENEVEFADELLDAISLVDPQKQEVEPPLPKLRDGWEWNINGVSCDSAIESDVPGNAVYVYGDKLVIEDANGDGGGKVCSCPADVALSVLTQSGIFDESEGGSE